MMSEIQEYTLPERLKELINNPLAENTNIAYRCGWNKFVKWCSMHDFSPLPAEPATVAAWLASLADEGKKASSIDTWRSAVKKVHKNANLPDPTAHEQVKNALRSIKRKIGSRKTKKIAIMKDDIKAMIDKLGGTPSDIRNKLILLWGYAGAFRRSELVNLNVEDITPATEGYKILVRRSKTDPESKGMEKAIFAIPGSPYCPVAAYQQWLAVSGIKSGAIFRHIDKHGVMHNRMSSSNINLILKNLVITIGIDPELVGGHSLRAGFVTQLIKKGTPAHEIMVQTGHKNYQTLREYIRSVDLFENNGSRNCLD